MHVEFREFNYAFKPLNFELEITFERMTVPGFEFRIPGFPRGFPCAGRDTKTLAQMGIFFALSNPTQFRQQIISGFWKLRRPTNEKYSVFALGLE